MSAYMVSREHIDVLVNAGGPSSFRSAVSWWWNGETHRFDACAVGALLIAENLRSIHARYPDCDPSRGGHPDNTPGPIARYWERPYRAQPCLSDLPVVAVLKALQGYMYQACETADWTESEAHAYCQALQTSLIRRLPGYEDAAWEIEDAGSEDFADLPTVGGVQ